MNISNKPRFRYDHGRLIPVRRMPAGLARGCFDLISRGTGLMVTVWGNRAHQYPNPPWNHVRGVPLWQQELSILVKEQAPVIAARLMWAKLWAKLEEIPESEAIE